MTYRPPLHVSRAYNRVHKAVARGELVKPTACEECGAAGYIEAAHEHYEGDGLAVRWLCRDCHREWDREHPKPSDPAKQISMKPETCASCGGSLEDETPGCATCSERARRRRYRAGERRQAPSHCKRGHPLSGDNAYLHSGRRHCRRCQIDRQRARRAAAG